MQKLSSASDTASLKNFNSLQTNLEDYSINLIRALRKNHRNLDHVATWLTLCRKQNGLKKQE